MRRIVKFLIIIVGISAAQESHDNDVADLLGEIQRKQIQSGDFANWFGSHYEEYQIDQEILSAVRLLTDDVSISIYFGTWCHDSKRQVPRLFSILDALKFGPDRFNLVALNKAKEMPAVSPSGLKIEHTPTFIFYRKSVEIGRIIETPVETLESDMLVILQGGDYIPNHSGGSD